MSLAGSHAPRRIRSSTLALAGGGVALAAGGAWLLRTFDPNAPGNPFPPCMFYSATGWHCPACGLTRCLHALAHGDLPRAFSMNRLLFVLLAVMQVHENRIQKRFADETPRRSRRCRPPCGCFRPRPAWRAPT